MEQTTKKNPNFGDLKLSVDEGVIPKHASQSLAINIRVLYGKRTHELRETANTTWKKEFEFPVRDIELESVSFRVWEADKPLNVSDLLGSLMIPLTKIIRDPSKPVQISDWYEITESGKGRLKISFTYTPCNNDSFASFRLQTRSLTVANNLLTYKENLKKEDPMQLAVPSKLPGFREMVSLKKKRFKNEKYDLDLAYITDKIIAMGFPSTGVEKIYRNNMEDIRNFLQDYHAGNYKVYNLCQEKKYQYEPVKFQQLRSFPFEDHNCPTLEQIDEFCRDATEWLDKSPENVAAVHCKAGKGRTGLMICCLLRYKYSDKISTDESLEFYAERRTRDGKGVTIPSQLRFVRYFGSIQNEFKDKTWKPDCPKKLLSITVNGMISPCCPLLKISTKDLAGHDAQIPPTYPKNRTKDYSAEYTTTGVILNRETKVILFKDDTKAKPLFYFWFHTKFVKDNELVLKLGEVDKLKKKEKYTTNFSVTLRFEDYTPTASS